MPREKRTPISIQFSPTERETIAAAAEQADKFPSTFIRETSVKAARRELAKRKAKKGGAE